VRIARTDSVSPLYAREVSATISTIVMLSPVSSLPSPALAAEITKLASSGETRRYAAGATIFQAGATGDGFYVVQSGHVQLTALTGDNPSRVLATVGPGDFFGEMAVIDDAPRSANAVAAEDVVVVFLGKDTSTKSSTPNASPPSAVSPAPSSTISKIPSRSSA
jgi:CRP-like cAMP-binding protein